MSLQDFAILRLGIKDIELGQLQQRLAVAEAYIHELEHERERYQHANGSEQPPINPNVASESEVEYAEA